MDNLITTAWVHVFEEDTADALRAVEDPVLADLWGDPENAVYDDL
mgnify:CR=1 FL=1